METQAIQLDRDKAKELYRDYKKHSHYSTPIDHEVRRAYQLIAQGRMIIKALESIKTAGLNEQKLPNLAIARADAAHCRFAGRRDGGGVFFDVQPSALAWQRASNAFSRHFDFADGSFPGVQHDRFHYEAIVPGIPIDKRPKRGIANYHILWEAEWSRKVPVDPMLLRRIGRGDMWLVVAAWDLTEVERAALSARLRPF